MNPFSGQVKPNGVCRPFVVILKQNKTPFFALLAGQILVENGFSTCDTRKTRSNCKHMAAVEASWPLSLLSFAAAAAMCSFRPTEPVWRFLKTRSPLLPASGLLIGALICGAAFNFCWQQQHLQRSRARARERALIYNSTGCAIGARARRVVRNEL